MEVRKTRMWRLVRWSAAGLCALLIGYTLLVVRYGFERTRELEETISALRHSGLQVSDLQPGWLDDLLAVEDPAFGSHNGIDLKTPGAGMTTITQGLVKLHYFEKFKPGMAKYKQSILALVLDREVSKEDQLLLFINTASLGHVGGGNIQGFEAASQAYYKNPFAEITHHEFLSLVAMLIGPGRYNPARHPGRNSVRVEKIKNLLAGTCSPNSVFDVEYESCDPERRPGS